MEGERTMLLPSGAVTVRLRRSARARQLRLVLNPVTGPELVVPLRTSASAIDAALATLAPWLERALARRRPDALGLARAGVAWLDGDAIPLRVEVPTGSRGACRLTAGELVLRAPSLGTAAQALERWYRSTARTAIDVAISLQAPAIGVTPTSVAVRDQRTRWGSCSARGTLSFSWRLLLAPAWVLEDVVCHELCHLRVLNHSQAFWKLFEAHRPAADSRPWLRAHGNELAAYRPADSIGAP